MENFDIEPCEIHPFLRW